MPLSADDVRYIAKLARVALTDDEVARLEGQLSNILDNFQMLNEIDTEGVPPTAQSFALHNVERADVTRPSCPPDEVLKNAPRREDDYFRVRGVLD
jgi:aspartyl-tRNA(Asn)/glutamyl-tRNA(Gln) amidotransferase subunit C